MNDYFNNIGGRCQYRNEFDSSLKRGKELEDAFLQGYSCYTSGTAIKTMKLEPIYKIICDNYFETIFPYSIDLRDYKDARSDDTDFMFYSSKLRKSITLEIKKGIDFNGYIAVEKYDNIRTLHRGWLDRSMADLMLWLNFTPENEKYALCMVKFPLFKNWINRNYRNKKYNVFFSNVRVVPSTHLLYGQSESLIYYINIKALLEYNDAGLLCDKIEWLDYFSLNRR